MAKKRSGAPAPRRPARELAGALEWLGDIAPGTARLTCVGCGALLVENHLGVAEVTPCRVRLTTSAGALTVEGENLALENVRPRQLTVRGRIDRISLPGKGGGGRAE